jgi:hypothetical protein
MLDRQIVSSPQFYARLGGVLYLLIIGLGFFAEGVVGARLIVSGDAAATVHNILNSPSLWRLGVAANVIVPLCAVGLLAIEYMLLKPAAPYLTLLAVFFNLVSLSIEAISKLFLFAVVDPLSGQTYLRAFTADQLQALSYLALRSHDAAFNLALIFFAFTLIIYGVVIFKSRYLPRFLGVLLPIAGGCYLTACASALFAPALYELMFPYILLPPFIGEASYCLWLLIKGVDVPQWNARIHALQAAGRMSVT